MKLPVGFRPITLERMLIHFQPDAPTLGPLLWDHLKLPEGDARIWIGLLEEKGLVQFAIAPTGEPSVFIAPKQENGAALYPSEAEYALANTLVSFWDTTGKFDSEHGNIVSAELPPHMSQIHTPQGPVAVAEQVALRLWKLGLIKEEHHRLVAPSKMQLYTWTQEQGICDFCSESYPKHVVMVPDFDLMPEVSSVPRSEGGWMACDTCHEMIQTNHRTDLLRRAIEHSSGGRFTAAALEGLHKRFWKQMDLKVEAAGIGMGLVDFIEDRISPEKDFINPKLQDKARRIEAIRRLTGLSTDEMEALQKGDVLHKETARKLAAWRKKYGMNVNSPEGERRITDFLNTMDRPMPQIHQPHWQVALDRKVEAHDRLAKIGRVTGDDAGTVLDIMEDVTELKLADVYSFNADTIHAILEGAKSIPHESTLKSVEIPTSRAGWYWFAEPLEVPASPISSSCTHALLWGWEMSAKVPTLRFSAYVVDDGHTHPERKGQIWPAAKWYWPVEFSFHDMIGLAHQMYQRAYGPGSPDSPGKEMAIGEQHTLKVIADLSIFFMMSCLWFRQTVPGTKKKLEPKLTREAGHIERHARKRYERDFKATPTVHVIALRKSAVEREEREEVSAEDGKTHLHVRFIVRGHARLQPCGPGNKDRKLIWIDPFVKGPDDAPFKESGPRVFAVIR